MERDWPRLQAQTRLAVKKERPLEEKVLADIRKKVKQVEKMLNPALGNTRLSNATAHEARETATAAANVRLKGQRSSGARGMLPLEDRIISRVPTRTSSVPGFFF